MNAQTTTCTAAELAHEIAEALNAGDLSARARKGVLTGTAMSSLSRAVNAGAALILAERDRGTGKGSDAAVRRLRGAEERLGEAAAVCRALAPIWAQAGIDVAQLLEQFFADAGRVGERATAEDVARARAEVEAFVAAQGGARVVAKAKDAVKSRNAAEESYIAERREVLREMVAGAFRAQVSGTHLVSPRTLAALWERLFASAERQAQWTMEAVATTRLPSRIATLGAEAADLARLAKTCEVHAELWYSLSDIGAAHEVAGGEVADMASNKGLGLFD